MIIKYSCLLISISRTFVSQLFTDISVDHKWTHHVLDIIVKISEIQLSHNLFQISFFIQEIEWISVAYWVLLLYLTQRIYYIYIYNDYADINNRQKAGYVIVVYHDLVIGHSFVLTQKNLSLCVCVCTSPCHILPPHRLD